MEYTVCIIGSGAAGGTLAVELVQKGFAVTVIESGNNEPDYSMENMVDKVDVSGEMDLRFGFSRQVGGATNLWAGRMAPLEENDFSKWPISLEDMDSYYVRAADMLGLSSVGRFDGDIPSFFDIDGIEQKKFLWAKKPFNAGVYLHEALPLYPSLTIKTGARVSKLVLSDTKDSIKEIVVLSDDGKSAEHIKADVFVLAAGGIETPRLLLYSGLGGDAVGRYFSTHPKADMALLKLNKRVSTHDALFSDMACGDGAQRNGIGFSSAIQSKEKTLNHYVQLSPLVEYKASKIFENIKGSSVLKSRFIDGSKMMKGIIPAIGLFVFDMIGRLSGLQKKTSLFMLRGFLDQYPNPDNRITLSDKVDKFGVPLANIEWKFTDEDNQSVVRFFDILDDKLRSSGIGHLEYSEMVKMKDWPLIGIHSHFMGTTRMGENPATSVTDANARVHGVQNLFIAGPSLFPTYGYANPVLTITALSLRLAEYLSLCLKLK